MANEEERDAVFQEHRAVLVGVAYRILGSVADAEDVVQEAWLRWPGVDAAKVEDARAFLIRVTSRLAIDRLRRVRARREEYVGPWLPEPLRTGPDGAAQAELADSVELALLVVLETLSPLERAAFVLREAFGLPYAEIAAAIGRSEPAVRQLARRAREHVQARRPRFAVDRAERRRVTERFLAAAAGGDLDGLVALLAPDAALVGDGGGKAPAPLRVIRGAVKVARFLLAIAKPERARRQLALLGLPESAAIAVEIDEVNGGPAIVGRAAGVPVVLISPVVADGLVTTVYLIANPDKLAPLAMSRRDGRDASART
ncbi:RNA polymerase sigma24 factor [Thermopolyspora flexuosa]|uniref:RNA polymerase sigma-70 factor (ECF subfamily) n=1 Tax=Thermopolyspora flexuosa TaxID=103836 RepID=A0A543IVA5_9ACTN|nr:RNA polymerase sigma factor SigJ [Thermopolyspora flexuosa]TQM74497.1 RNA polymerase sigma-70 factor (ECF subfamily) [Thermopolyspora flexuosa]GGM76599.1 RNA polymerase sigma24 factor [Thermopolyspora flexuosa]